MNQEQFSFKSKVDQLSITGYRWMPDDGNSLVGVVVIAHGMAEHALRYVTFANALNKVGYIVYVHDHRGHGASPGPRGLGDFGVGGWDALVEDIAQVVTLANEQFPDLPVSLMGHSMGSFASQQFVLSHAELISSLILSGSAAIDRLFAATAELRRLNPETGLNIHNANFTHRTGYEWLSRDEKEVDKYVADPLCGFELLPESIGGLINRAAFLADPRMLEKIPKDLPVLLLAGDKDPVTGCLLHLEVLRERYEKAGVKRVDTLYYESGRHEMLNEINRDQVCHDIIRWLALDK